MAAVAVQLMSNPGITSASGIISLLDETDVDLRCHALEKLHSIVDHFWAEIADAVPLIESLSEDTSFPQRELAASLASKCFFHLEEYSDALRLAMSSGKYFDVNCKSQYVETLIATCIDEYTQLRTGDEPATIDSRMENVVERMFERCYADETYAQALGIALEARRMDKVKEVFSKAKNLPEILAYCFDVCRNIISNRDFRLKVLEEMVTLYKSLPTPDYSSMCQCLELLDKASEVAAVLESLVKSDVDSTLIAFQISFDLHENENQHFLIAVKKGLPVPPAAAEGENATVAAPPTGAHADYWTRISNLNKILSGSVSNDLMLDFLYRKSDSDPLLMKTIKTAVENRNSILHNSAVVAHSYFNAGSTVDSFLRDNLDWMGKASNWAKFTATSSLGVVHKGHTKESMNLLQPYLPNGGVSGSPYSEGGALFALGLIHANSVGPVTAERVTYLREALRNAGTDETVQHGACLGLGLASIASHDYEVYEELKNIMFTDSAVAGEASTIAIGLCLLGAGTSTERNSGIVQEIFAYAHDTKHEKIIRGAVMAIALIMYGQEEEADGLIEQMTRDKDPVIRYGAMYTIAMAYAGTANNTAVKRLLHVAVSDVSDDVRRAAVTCLGFLLFRTPVQVPKLVSLLAESFNPHVRYGSCLAVGIACAGTAKNEAIQLLEPMMEDPVDYVRQGAILSMAMVLMQESEGKNSKVKSIREKIFKLITDKHQTTMTKMGAILAHGILDAGGRNSVISMTSRTGFTKMSAVVGLALWAQHWFWYPLMHFMELALQPTALVGLNYNLKIPKSFSVKCNSKPSMFAYTKHMEEKKEEKKELVKTAVLSTTAKAKARQAKQDLKHAEEKGETPPPKDAMDVETEEKEEKAEEENAQAKPVAPEPDSFELSNPSRVTHSQVSYLEFDLKQRYVPIIAGRREAGVIMLKDTSPTEPEDVADIQAPAPAAAEEEEDAPPPEPFEWEAPKTS